MAFNFIANTAAILAIGSNAIEAGELGTRRASKSADTAVAVNDIKNYTGDTVLNKSSEKHNAMKQMVRKADTLTGFHKIKGGTLGFVSGIVEGMKGNWLSTGFAALTLISKNKTVKTVGLIGTGASMLWDFIKNGTNLFARKNTLEK